MNKNRFIVLLLLFAGLFFQSCNKEEDTTSTTEALNRGDRPNPGQQNGNAIRTLDNEILKNWTQTILEVERHAGGMRPNASARALAYINLAAYETAVPGMREYTSNADRLSGLRIRQNQLPRRINWELALNAAYAKSTAHFLINISTDLEQKILTFERDNERRLSRGLDQNLVRESKAWGQYVASQVIAYALTDREAESQILEPQPNSYEPPTGDGYWTYSADPERALFPYWKSVRTFVVATDQTTTVDPIPYSEASDSEYFAQMKEVYEVNNKAKEEQNDDLWIAEFWSDDVEGLMMSPPARQLSIANQLIDLHEMNLEESLVMYVKLGFALNDAAVATWNYKYQYMVMRPNVFIHEFIDPTYQTNLYRLIYWDNPSFPGYPSGHSCFASVATGVFVNFLGNDFPFIDRTHEGRTEFKGEARSFDNLKEMARENAFSRIPLGVHIRMDCEEGLRLGYEISDGINSLNLKRRNT